MTEHYDVIIIGTGAGGGTLAHTGAGRKNVLLLERGDFLPREMDNWNSGAVFADGRYISQSTWYDADGKPFQPQVHYFAGGAAGPAPHPAGGATRRKQTVGSSGAIARYAIAR